MGGRYRKKESGRQKEREIRDCFLRMWFSVQGFKGGGDSMTNRRVTF